MQQMKMTLDMAVMLNREGDGWVASCPALRMASQGKTQTDALAMFKEAAQLNFEVISERRNLAEVLAEAAKQGGISIKARPGQTARKVTMPVPVRLLNRMREQAAA